MARFLLIVAGSILVCTGATVWVTKQPGPWSSTVVGPVFIGVIAVIAAAAFRCLWSPMLAAFPPREPKPDAVRRKFQSFGLGIVNMGLSIHVAADDEHLHLDPLPIWQALGARRASIPWSAMEPVGKSGRVVRVGGHRLDGPKWCMELASPREEEGAGDGSTRDERDGREDRS